MTGYGETTTETQDFTAVSSVRTVNHRYLDIRIRGLENFRKLEAKSEKLLKKSFSRGRIDVSIDISVNSNGDLIIYDLGRAKKYYQCLASLAEELNLDQKPNLSHLIRLGGVFSEDNIDESAIWPALKDSLSESIQKVKEARAKEGEILKEDLITRIDKLKDYLRQIEEDAPKVKGYYKKKLKKRVKELLEGGEVEIDENRLEEEAVMFADRSDIAEEITRLHSHLKSFRELLENKAHEKETVGDTLDFLAQEMQREVNTIGSKAGQVGIQEKAVKMKSQIKKIREQVRNIE